MDPGDFEEFVALMERNLAKNGYPDKRVAFPLERMYEEADKRGFSFNKVRDVLREKGVASELTDERVIFSPLAQAQEDDVGEVEMARKIFERMTPQQREEVMKMAQSMTPQQMEEMKRQWGALSEKDRRSMMEQMQNGGMPFKAGE